MTFEDPSVLQTAVQQYSNSATAQTNSDQTSTYQSYNDLGKLKSLLSLSKITDFGCAEIHSHDIRSDPQRIMLPKSFLELVGLIVQTSGISEPW